MLSWFILFGYRECLCKIRVKEWKSDEELKARVHAQKSFLVWPKDGGKKGSSLALKLNKGVLLPLVGRAESEPKLIAVPHLEPMLKSLVTEWAVT